MARTTHHCLAMELILIIINFCNEFPFEKSACAGHHCAEFWNIFCCDAICVIAFSNARKGRTTPSVVMLPQLRRIQSDKWKFQNSFSTHFTGEQ